MSFVVKHYFFGRKNGSKFMIKPQKFVLKQYLPCKKLYTIFLSEFLSNF